MLTSFATTQVITTCLNPSQTNQHSTDLPQPHCGLIRSFKA